VYAGRQGIMVPGRYVFEVYFKERLSRGRILLFPLKRKKNSSTIGSIQV
jgi:hypothetical protein